MILEEDLIYYAMQLLGENGYIVIKDWFFYLMVVLFSLVTFAIGYRLGSRRKNKKDKKIKTGEL